MTTRPTATLVPAQLAHPLVAEGHLKVGHDARLYRYEAGVYRPDGERWLRMRARDELGEDFRQSVVNEIVAYAKSEMGVAFDSTDIGLVNLQNGLLDSISGELRPHSPNHLSTIQLPVEWDPRATCPQIDSFLNEVLDPTLHPLLEEVIGLLLIPETRYRKAVLLLGSGQNGKSTLLTVIRSLLGSVNVSAVSLQALSNDKFKVAELVGKLANICADIDYRAARDSAVFKIITGGTDWLTGERKYATPFTFRPTTRLLFSANEVPGTMDHSPAYFDRWLVLPMDRRITRPVLDFDDKLTTSGELAGLLARAVGGLARLQQRGYFQQPTAASSALDQYRLSVDPVLAFLADRTIANPGYRVSRAELRSAFEQFCSESGHQLVGQKRFAERLRVLRPGLVETKANGNRGWAGIGLVPPANAAPLEGHQGQQGHDG